MSPRQRYPSDLIEAKQNGQRISMVTAYDTPTARLIETAGIHVALVGDSCGNVVAGYSSTIPVTMEQMIYHTQAVSRGCDATLVVADLPYMSYHRSSDQAIKNATRLIQSGGAQAVKMEILPAQVSHLKAVVDAGIPVMAHIGFTPQTLHQLGGYKIQGKSDSAANLIADLAAAIQAAGAFSLVLEMVPHHLAKRLQTALRIPTIGIGAGPHCDGQVLVFHDLIGLSEKPPKFAKAYTNSRAFMRDALELFKHEVESGDFPPAELS